MTDKVSDSSDRKYNNILLLRKSIINKHNNINNKNNNKSNILNYTSEKYNNYTRPTDCMDHQSPVFKDLASAKQAVATELQQKKRKPFKLRPKSTRIMNSVEEAKAETEKELESKKIIKVSQPVEELLSIWYDAGLRQHRSRMTKVFRKDVKYLQSLLSGAIFKKTQFESLAKNGFTYVDFEYACEAFSRVVNNSKYKPKDKSTVKRITIHQFIYNPYGKMKSWFIYLLSNHPELINQPDKCPKMTKALLDAFVKEVADGFVFDLSPREVEHIKKGAELAEKFFEDNPKIPPDLIDTYEKKAAIILNALRVNFAPKGKQIKPHHLSNPITYGLTLAEYLKIKTSKNVVTMSSRSMYRFR